MILATAAMLPPWIVVPPALILVIAVGSHMMGMRAGDMPESRRRLRTVNGLMMLITVPLTAYAFCAVSPADPRWFVLTWTGVVGLIGLVIILAIADILNNLWIAHRAARELHARMRAVRLALLDARRVQALQHAQQQPSPDP